MVRSNVTRSFHLFVSLPDLRDHDAYIPLNDVNPRTNTVANIKILHINFSWCDVLIACPHRKLNRVSGSVYLYTKTERLWSVNTIERRAASHIYCYKRMFIKNMFVLGVLLVAVANGKTQGAVYGPIQRH
jgi:hypothetical protein